MTSVWCGKHFQSFQEGTEIVVTADMVTYVEDLECVTVPHHKREDLLGGSFPLVLPVLFKLDITFPQAVL